jgi:hypothetical protein
MNQTDYTSHRIAAGPSVIVKNDQLKSTEHAELNTHGDEHVSNGGINGDLTWETVTFLVWMYGRVCFMHRSVSVERQDRIPCSKPRIDFDAKPRNGRPLLLDPWKGVGLLLYEVVNAMSCQCIEAQVEIDWSCLLQPQGHQYIGTCTVRRGNATSGKL